jgi:predicted permease
MMLILTSILPIAILIVFGVILQKLLPRQPESSKLMCQIGLGSCETWTTVLNKFALYLSLPALVFSSLVRAGTDAILPFPIIIYNIVLLIVLILLVRGFGKLRKWPKSLINTYFFGAFFGNVAYIGPPFLLSLYGDVSGLLSMIIAIHIGVAFTVGLFFLELSTQDSLHHSMRAILQKLIRNPLLLSVLAGILVIIFDIPVPAAIYEATYMLGVSASPIVLIAVGTFIATEWSPRKNIHHAINITAIKLIAMPTMFLLVGQYFFAPSDLLHISILEAAMPIALSNFALAEEYPMDKKITANAIILSTIVSIITLSIFSALLVV